MPIEDEQQVHNPPLSNKETPHHPLGTVFIAICLAFGLQILLPVFLSLFFDSIFGTSLQSGMTTMRIDSELEQILMKLTIILTQTLAFGGVAFAAAMMIPGNKSMLPMRAVKNPALILISMFAALSALPVIPYTMIPKEWMQLPESMKALQDALLGQEEQTAKYLSALLKNHFLVNLLFIAVTPAIMEELFFRGMMLNQFRKVINVHLAIWLTGFLFSLFHFQILGFFPRMLLGVIFGYMAYWSGSLIPCMIAHFTNNAMSAVAYFFSKNETNAESVLDVDYQPPIWVGLLGIATLSGLMYLFYYYARVVKGQNE